MIEGLREERKLWGKELAHQGAALAQDRGRMEAQLDTLTKECKALQVRMDLLTCIASRGLFRICSGKTKSLNV